MKKPDPLKPRIALLCKLGSAISHCEEAADQQKGHAFDVLALRQLMADPEVAGWMEAMRAQGLISVKR